MSKGLPIALLAALGAASCGAPLMKLPAGPGTPIPDADAYADFHDATMACLDLNTLTAEVGVSGSAGGQRVRGRLLAGVTPGSSARLEAVAPFGQPLFIFVSGGGETTLLLPRDNRVLTHPSARDVLAAVAGVPLDTGDLFTTLTSCAPVSAVHGEAVGSDWRVLRGQGLSQGQTFYLHRDSASRPWRLVAIVEPAWRAEFRDFVDGLPRSIHLTNGPQRAADAGPFDLTLKLAQVEQNAKLDPEVFLVQVPPDAEPISIDELRRSGPLGQGR